MYRVQFRDDIYVNGSIVRQDFTIGTPEGRAVLDELRTEFPEYGPFGPCKGICTISRTHSVVVEY